MLKTKLAGSQTQLSAAIASVLDETRQKMKLAAEAKADEKDKVKKLVDYEKKEHGGKVPSVKEEKEECEEKKASLAIDPTDPEEVTKLAAALDEMAEKLADAVVMGGESHQGGEVLPVQRPAAGTQPVPSKGKAKTPKGMSSSPSDAPSQGVTATDEHRAPGGTGAKYPAKGVLKTGSAPVDALKAVTAAAAATKTAAAKPAAKVVKLASKKESSALDYVLNKISGADIGGESKQGGETLPSYDKPKMQPGRALIQNAQKLKDVTKPEAKAPRKAELAEVLTEPASKRGVADNIHGNLRSASKGGVKTAAAKALLAKIAEEGCTCDGKNSCRNCKVKSAAAEIASRKATDEKQATV